MLHPEVEQALKNKYGMRAVLYRNDLDKEDLLEFYSTEALAAETAARKSPIWFRKPPDSVPAGWVKRGVNL